VQYNAALNNIKHISFVPEAGRVIQNRKTRLQNTKGSLYILARRLLPLSELLLPHSKGILERLQEHRPVRIDTVRKEIWHSTFNAINFIHHTLCTTRQNFVQEVTRIQHVDVIARARLPEVKMPK
jgi:hypothetical protein